MPKLFTGPTEIPVKKLRLDKQNVRFYHLGGKLSEEQIEQHLYDNEDVRVLIKQILGDGQVLIPLYVIPDGEEFVVKEGNRRTVALRRIIKDCQSGKLENFPKGHFDNVSAFIFDQTTTEKEIDILLGTIHVSGPRSWAAANKAGHINNLIEYHGETVQSIAEELGMTKGQVQEYYEAFQACVAYGKKYEAKNGSYIRKYSYFAELVKNRYLRQWLKEESSNLDYFIDLVGENKISYHKNVRKLAKIVRAANPARGQAFEILNQPNGDIEKAAKVLDTNNGGCWRDIFNTVNMLRKFPHEALTEAINDIDKKQSLAQLIATATGLQNSIEEMQKKGVLSA